MVPGVSKYVEQSCYIYIFYKYVDKVPKMSGLDSPYYFTLYEQQQEHSTRSVKAQVRIRSINYPRGPPVLLGSKDLLCPQSVT
jgi:hypothetical protein